MTGHRIALGKSVKIKDGKLVRVQTYVAGQRKNQEGKAKRLTAAWTSKSKPKDKT